MIINSNLIFPTGLPQEILLQQLEETGGKIIFCFQNSVKKFSSKSNTHEIVVMPDGEEVKDDNNVDIPNVVSWQKFSERGLNIAEFRIEFFWK